MSATLLAWSLWQTGFAGYVDRSLTSNGNNRSYRVVEPDGEPTGLIIHLHGWGSYDACMDTVFFNDELQPFGPAITNNTGALVVCPEARKYTSNIFNRTWDPMECWQAFPGGGYCEDLPSFDGDDDITFLEQLIDDVKKDYTIPHGKVVLAGCSNGASMTYRFGCERADLIDVIVTSAQSWFDPWLGWGALGFKNSSPSSRCQPSRPVPLFSIVGTEDIFYNTTYMSQWETRSSDVYGCAGSKRLESTQGRMNCYGYESCTTPVANRMCSVDGVPHSCVLHGYAVLQGMEMLDAVPNASRTDVSPEEAKVDSAQSLVPSAVQSGGLVLAMTCLLRGSA